MRRTARRAALAAFADPFFTPRPPAGGWHRNGGGDDGGDGSSGGGTGSGANSDGDDAGKADDNAPKIDGDFDADRARRAIAAARDAEKKAKGDAKVAKDQVAAILAAAGLKPDGTKDPAEQLKEAAAKADAAEKRARDTAVELAVYKSAGKAGADPDALLDSRGFLTAVADLDPDAADFGDKVTTAIKAAVKNNSKLAADGAKGPGKQGADHSGNGGQKPKPKNLTEAIAARLGG
jgi:hypothetical protein